MARGAAFSKSHATMLGATGHGSLGHMFAIDHLAFPCFDVAATCHFYEVVLGATLRHAQKGPAAAWNADEYLLMAFELPGGVLIDFFSFDGIRRPGGGTLPKDIWHVALSVGTRDAVAAMKERLAAEAIPFWVETHDVDDVHLYATDPNGLTLEFLADRDSVRGKTTNREEARHVVERWTATHSV